MSFRSLCFTLIIPIILLTGLSCSSSTTSPGNPLTPSISPKSSNDATSTHSLWGYFLINIDPSSNSSEIVPVRDIATHWNILKFLEKTPCNNCLKIKNITDTSNGTKLVDIQISHPFTGMNLTGFDVRGIAMFHGGQTFPDSGLTAPNRYLGDGELVNPDGYTALYNATTLGKGPGGMQGYFPGKFSTATIPNALLNGYKRFISDSIENTRNTFLPTDAITITYEIDMPDTVKIIGYAIDASWAPAKVFPVTDPKTDFPPEANCPEPWKIAVSELPGKGLTSGGGQTVLNIDVYDHQGKTSHLSPRIECSDLFPGTIIATPSSDSLDFASYQVTIVNEELAPEGQYRCLIAVEDSENAISPEWLDLTAYQIVSLNVIKSGWARTFGSDQSDHGETVDVDSEGNSYIAGEFMDTVDFDPGTGVDERTAVGSLDCYLSKYSPSGKLIWARTWGGPNWDQINDVALDDSGNFYITGMFTDTADFDPGPDVVNLDGHGDWDIFLMKLNSDGNYVWAINWGGGYWDVGEGLDVDGSNVYVTGEFRGKVDFDPGPGTTFYDAVPGASFVSKFDTSGKFKWARYWSGDGGYDDQGFDVVAHDGVVYISGVFDGGADFDTGATDDQHASFNFYQDCYLTKFLDTGVFQWAVTWGGAIDDWPYGMSLDSLGNIYLAGNFGDTVDFDPGPLEDNHTSNGERDAYLTSFAPDGTHLWAVTWGGSNGGNWDNTDRALGLFIDNTDRIYVSGEFGNTVDFDPGPDSELLTSNGSYDGFLDVFDTTGNQLWARSWGGPLDDHGIGVAVDISGNAFVCGNFSLSADFDPGIWVDEHYSHGSIDAFLMKFLPDGVW
jgi:hypothetical protein